MQITFWGVRGSIPTPGPDTVAIGGNTSCVELRAGKALLVFDGGTGLRLLGKKLLKEMPITAHIFFSHVHWDHIQGFPFFDPAFVKGNEIHLYGGNNVTRTLEETLAGQMDHPSFPVHLADMAAKMTFNDLVEGQKLELADGLGGKVSITDGAGAPPERGVALSRRARREDGRVRHGHRAREGRSTRTSSRSPRTRTSSSTTRSTRPRSTRGRRARGARKWAGGTARSPPRPRSPRRRR